MPDSTPTIVASHYACPVRRTPWRFSDGAQRRALQAVSSGRRALPHPLANPGVLVADAWYVQVIGVLRDEPADDFHADGSIFGEIATPSGQHRRVVPGAQVVRVVRVVHALPRWNAGHI